MDIKVKVTINEFGNAMESGKNMIGFGPSGYGKTAKVYEVADKLGKKVLPYDLAGKLPEEVAGIPSVDGEYYTRALDRELEHFFEVEGDGYILLFDEVNQGAPETLNTLYNITHPDPEKRRWANHKIGKCQVVALGNLSDGTDGTVYLTDLPTPLLNRFFVFEIKPSKKDATAYLKTKYKNIKQVGKYISTLLDNNISPRDIDQCLEILEYDYSSMLMEAKIGSALTTKIYDIKKGIHDLDPAQLQKNAREIYKVFKEDGEVTFGLETITTEAQLKDKLLEMLNEEEVAAIFKGGEE